MIHSQHAMTPCTLAKNRFYTSKTSLLELLTSLVLIRKLRTVFRPKLQTETLLMRQNRSVSLKKLATLTQNVKFHGKNTNIATWLEILCAPENFGPLGAPSATAEEHSQINDKHNFIWENYYVDMISQVSENNLT